MKNGAKIYPQQNDALWDTKFAGKMASEAQSNDKNGSKAIFILFTHSD